MAGFGRLAGIALSPMMQHQRQYRHDIFARDFLAANPDWREGMSQGHGRLLDLIRSGDEAAAVDAIGEHIRVAYTRIWAALSDKAESGSAPSQREIGASFLLS